MTVNGNAPQRGRKVEPMPSIRVELRDGDDKKVQRISLADALEVVATLRRDNEGACVPVVESRRYGGFGYEEALDNVEMLLRKLFEGNDQRNG